MGCGICNDPPFIFIHVPKTGGTSFISKAAKTGSKIDGLKVMNGHRYLRYIPNTLNMAWKDVKEKYFIFTIIRNPFDRFISLWRVRAMYTPLQEFIDDIKSKNEVWYQLKPQISWVGDSGGKLLVDHFIRFENYKDGINKVLDYLKIPRFELPHFRKTNREKNYRLYYKTKSQIDFVREFYKDDLEIFGYGY
jgi:hypothetical protein